MCQIVLRVQEGGTIGKWGTEEGAGRWGRQHKALVVGTTEMSLDFVTCTGGRFIQHSRN